MWLTGLVAPRHVGSSRTRARTCVPCTGRRILNHCATREAQRGSFEAGQGVDWWGGDSLDKGAEGEAGRLNEQLCWDRGLSPWGRVESESFSSGSALKFNQCVISDKTLGLLEPQLAHHQCGCQLIFHDDHAHERGYGKVRLYKVFIVAILGNDH